MEIKNEEFFLNLDPDDQERYVQYREIINTLLGQPDGLTFILNAIIAVGSETDHTSAEQWFKKVTDGRDARDLVAECSGPERIIGVHSTFVYD